jgi:hypothetical protein
MKSSSKLISILALAGILGLTGCSFEKNPTASNNENLADGTAGSISQEVTDMTAAVSIDDFSGSAKILAETEDTIEVTASYSRRPWEYKEGWWVREVQVTINQYTCNKIDSIQYTDSTGAVVQRPRAENATGWTHYRHVERSGAVNTHVLDLAMTVAIDRSIDTAGTWNGTLNGTWNGEQISSTVITNVVRKRVQRSWRFPESGTISIDRPTRTIEIEYTGEGSANALITRKIDNKTTRVLINVSTGKETVQE